MKTLDNLLNQVTMYRLTLYYLLTLLGVAFILSLFGALSYNPLDILLNTMVAVGICWASNHLWAKLFKVSPNIESSLITALILVLIIPVKFPDNVWFLAAASIIAMAGKYLLTVERSHIFNPAALAALAAGLLFTGQAATWWVGTPFMMPFVLIGGILLIRKTAKFRLVLFFVLSYFALMILSSLLTANPLATLKVVVEGSLLHSALLFFGFVLLTEPLTSPSVKKWEVPFAALVAILFATPELKLGFALTPEAALCIGNIFSHWVNPNQRFVLSLTDKQAVSTNIFLFSFAKPANFIWTPGQYLEWTLPHPKTDSRGNRRFFSLASSPQGDVKILVKIADRPSSFKKSLVLLDKGDKIIASRLAGDFILPKNLSNPLVFMAGGVGIAPFKAMIDYILEQKLKVNIVLLYANRLKEDILFKDIFAKAQEQGVKTVYTLTSSPDNKNWQGRVGRINQEMIKEEVPDYLARSFYISGPQLLVESYKDLLLKMGIPRNKIITDYFSGYSDK